MRIKKLQVVICSDQMPQTRDFYKELLGFTIDFDSDWCVQLISAGTAGATIILHRRDYELLPEWYRERPPGCHFLSFEVDDVDAVWEKAQAMQAEILNKPGSDEHDRRSLVVLDPNGILVEVVSPSDPGEAERSEYMLDQ